MGFVLFLDDGGVLNDNETRGRQYQRLVGEYFAPRLGGTVEQWGAANKVVFDAMWSDYLRRIDSDPDYNVAMQRESDNDRWLAEMCRHAGVAAPGDRHERVQLAEAAMQFITRNIRATYPGVVETIFQLTEGGYSIHTASGSQSTDLDGYLTGMGVRHAFGTLYGPDIVNAAKSGPRYYDRIFSHAGLAPGEALVVDDNETALDWAASVGATTVLCRAESPKAPRHRHVPSLSELPALLTQINTSSGGLLQMWSFHLSE